MMFASDRPKWPWLVVAMIAFAATLSVIVAQSSRFFSDPPSEPTSGADRRKVAMAPSRNRTVTVEAPEGSFERPKTNAKGFLSGKERKTSTFVPEVPWIHPGNCSDGMDPEKSRKHVEYLARFHSVYHEEATLFVHPDVDEFDLGTLRSVIARALLRVSSALGLESEPPRIYLHANLEEMRHFSCTSSSALAYYDGAIHLASSTPSPRDERVRARATGTLLESLTHEAVHHALVTHGIGKPFWLQEGAALWIAGDQPQNSWALWREKTLDLETMHRGPAKNASLEDLARYDANAYSMMEFLDRLCLKRRPCGIAELVGALLEKKTSPEELFSWATSERGADLQSSVSLPLWRDYSERGNFSEPTLQALLGRPLPSE